ncbi:MAG TPA: formate transporter FocA [Pirellulaceae bacterium]|nr:formate transporter FocA [Pirellulaceae bacterium]
MEGIDALLPPAMAQKAEEVGLAKARLPLRQLVLLAILAGAFIAQGAIFSTVTTAGLSGQVPLGIVRLVAGVTFSLGLILVVIAGAELFTGNNLLVMAWASRRISTLELLRNWFVVFLGNVIGAGLTAVLMVLARHHEFGGGLVGKTMLQIAAAKCSLDFVQAVALGVACNALVCLAVWLSYSARSTVDKIFAVVPPIAAFVAAGFEHSIANLYFIPVALLVKSQAGDSFWTKAGLSPAEFDGITWERFLLGNLLPVTLGNILGGALLVGAIYWVVYRWPQEAGK